jgi:hypothetical protein
LKRATVNKTKNTEQDFTQILNCVGLLTRLIAVAFEDQSFEETVFWKNQIPLDTSSQSPKSPPPTKENEKLTATSETEATKSNGFSTISFFLFLLYSFL